MTLISVIMGANNNADMLGQTLDRFAQWGARMRVMHKDIEDLTRTLIDGGAQARGKYIARIDTGDVMLPERLALQAQVLEKHPKCSFVSCWTEFCGPRWEAMWLAEGAPASNQPVSVLLDDPEQGLLGDVPHYGSVMFRQEAYQRAGGYRAEFYYGQDWDPGIGWRNAAASKSCPIPSTVRAFYRAASA